MSRCRFVGSVAIAILVITSFALSQEKVKNGFDAAAEAIEGFAGDVEQAKRTEKIPQLSVGRAPSGDPLVDLRVANAGAERLEQSLTEAFAIMAKSAEQITNTETGKLNLPAERAGRDAALKILTSMRDGTEPFLKQRVMAYDDLDRLIAETTSQKQAYEDLAKRIATEDRQTEAGRKRQGAIVENYKAMAAAMEMRVEKHKSMRSDLLGMFLFVEDVQSNLDAEIQFYSSLPVASSEFATALSDIQAYAATLDETLGKVDVLTRALIDKSAEPAGAHFQKDVRAAGNSRPVVN